MNEERTAHYLTNFFGYGNWDSDFWFVGMEEGGGSEYNLVNNKIDAFSLNNEDHSRLVDNYDFQVHKVGAPYNNEALQFLGPRPDGRKVQLQSYWSKMIRVLLGFNAMEIDNESIREFQRMHWGRIHDNEFSLKHAIVEMMPLPSPGTGDWNYLDWTSHFTGTSCPVLRSRREYYSLLREDRVDLLKNKIAEHNPKFVLFNGFGHSELYDEITDNIAWEVKYFDGFRAYIGQRADTLFVKTYQPNARPKINGVTRGITNQYWDELISFLRVS